MAKLQFSPPITDVKEMIRNNKLNWEKSALKHYTKSSAVHFKPNRMDSTFEPDFIMPNFDIYGRAIVNKPGVYPYGSATGTTPVTSTSLKAGEYKSAKANGKGVTKRKQNKLWGRYVPVNGISFSSSQTFSTGLTLNDADTFVFDTKFAASTTRSLIGASTDQGAYFGMDASGRFELGGNVTIPVTTADPMQRNIVTFEYTGPSLPSKLTVNSVTIQRASKDTTISGIFAYPIPAYGGNGVTVYAYKAYQSGTLLCDRIAVKDVVTNEIGYFDRLTETFEAVTGTAGDLIQPIANVTNGTSSRFDTGVYAVDNMEMFVRVKAITGSFYLLQSRQNVGSTIYGISGGQSGNTIDAYGVNSGIARTAGHIYVIKLSIVNRVVTLYVKDETTGTEDTKTGTATASAYPFPSPTTLKLFGDASMLAAGATVYRAYIKINGEYAWQPIPVRIGTTVELLDLVNWQFATRTGTFTAGADLPYTQLCPDILETNAGDAVYGQYGTNKLKPSKGTAEYTGITCVGDGVKFHFSGTWNGNYLYTKISGDTIAACGSATVVKTYNTEPVIIPAGTTVKFIRKDLTYIRYMYFTTIDGDSTSFAWGATELEHTYTPSVDITAIWLQWSDVQRIEVPCDIYIGMFDPAETEYEDYHFGLHPSGEQTLVQEGKNWFGGTFNTRFTFHRPIKAGTTIYASGEDDSSQCYVRYYDADGNTITELRLSSTQQNRRMCSYTPAVDIYSCMFYNTSLNHLQIAETVAYEPYIAPQTVKIPTFLPSATSFIDAAKADNNVTCDWAIKVLTGTESVSYRYSDRIYPIFDIANILPDGKEAVKYGLSAECSHYEVTSWVTMVGGHDGKICVKDSDIGGNSVCIADHRFTDVQSFKAYLASEYAKGTPVIIAYPLATPAVSTLEITPVTQPLGTVTILNEFADGTKGAVDFYGVNIDIANPVPKPTEPYPLLSNVGEVIYGPGKNLFSSGLDRCTWAQNVGELVRKSDSTTRVGSADFIPVKPNTSYTLKMMGTQTFINGNWRVMLCGSDNICRQKIATSNIENTLKFTTGATEVKFAFFIAEDKTSVDGWDWMLVEGSAVPTEYEPYRFGWHGDGQQTVKMEGANIWNLGDFINGVGAQKTLEGLDTSKTYTILVKASSDYSTTGTVWSVSPRNADGTSRGNLFYMNDYVAGQTISAEFTGAAMLRIQGSNFSGSFYICVVEGSATEYIPYVTPQLRTTTEILPSATSKLNMQGGNNNEECDFNFKQLDGTETWNESSGYYYISLSGLVGAPLTAGVCTHFEYSSSQANGKFRFAGTGTANGNVVFYVTGQFATLAEWKAWLAANKPIVAYPTATTVKKTVEVTPFTIPDKMEYVASSDSELGSCDVDIICLSKSM